MSDLGPLSYYLGIEVRQGPYSVELNQCAYVAKLLEKAGMMNCNTCATPMEQRIKLSRKSNSATKYRSLALLGVSGTCCTHVLT
jgi:hypothetical protein